MENLSQKYEASEDELSAALKTRSRLLTFSDQLEQFYLDQHIPRAIRRFHLLLPVIVFLYAIIVTGIIGSLPQSSFALWTTIVISVTFGILCTMALSFFP
jgi:cyanate permease